MKYAVLGPGRKVQTVMVSPTEIDKSSIGRDSDGNLMILPIVTQKLEDIDTDLYTISSPKYDVHADQVYESFDVSPVPNFEEVLLKRVDDKCEEARSKILTDSITMSTIYAEKKSEAKDYLAQGYKAGSNPAPEGQYPLMEASVGVDGDNLDEVSMTIITKSKDFIKIAAAIESQRLKVKKQIRNASDISSKKAVFDNVVWGSEISSPQPGDSPDI